MATEPNLSYNLNEISNAFLIKGGVGEVLHYGSGHINDTFHVKNTDTNESDYLLQRINHYVFTEVPSLINNIKLVTQHIKEKLVGIDGYQTDKEVLTLIPTRNNQYYHKDADGNYWDVLLFKRHAYL